MDNSATDPFQTPQISEDNGELESQFPAFGDAAGEGPNTDWQGGWLEGLDEVVGAVEAREPKPAAEPDWAGASAGADEELGAMVYVGAALDVVHHIRSEYFLDPSGFSPLWKYVEAKQDDVVACFQAGRWKFLICDTFELAEDLCRYAIRQLEPLLNVESGGWKAENSVWYRNYLRELESSDAFGVVELEGKASGPGVYIFYHTDLPFWDEAVVTGEKKDNDARLREAVKFSQTGQAQAAREILVELIKSNPRNEMAWLWYAYNLPDHAERIRALEECLYHVPDSFEAKKRLDTLKRHEAMRTEAEKRVQQINEQIARLEENLQICRRDLQTQESELAKAEGLYATAVEQMEHAERNYTVAKDLVARTTREIDQLEAKLSQLQEQLAEG